ncbi:unnamed protein product, partial [marine sediment metagenome]
RALIITLLVENVNTQTADGFMTFMAVFFRILSFLNKFLWK